MKFVKIAALITIPMTLVATPVISAPKGDQPDSADQSLEEMRQQQNRGGTSDQRDIRIQKRYGNQDDEKKDDEEDDDKDKKDDKKTTR